MSTETEISGAVVPSAVITPAEGGLSALARAAVEAGQALSPHTLRAYKGDMKDFSDWCRGEGREPLPASADTLTEYATWLCYTRPVLDRGGVPVPGAPPGLSPATVRRMLASVAAAHKYAGLPSPRTEKANSVLKGYQKKLVEEYDHRARPRKATPLDPAALAAMTGRGLAGAGELTRLRDTALMYLDFNAGMRVSELVSMNIEGVKDEEWGLAVLVRRAKNGPYKEMPIDEAHAPLGVAAARKWIAALREHGVTSGPLFPRIYDGVINPARYRRGSPDGRMAARQIERIIGCAAREAGLKGKYTAHSGRRGIITQARLAGHGEIEIGRHTGHADGSVSLRGYIEEVDGRRNSPLRGAGA